MVGQDGKPETVLDSVQLQGIETLISTGASVSDADFAFVSEVVDQGWDFNRGVQLPIESALQAVGPSGRRPANCSMLFCPIQRCVRREVVDRSGKGKDVPSPKILVLWARSSSWIPNCCGSLGLPAWAMLPGLTRLAYRSGSPRAQTHGGLSVAQGKGMTARQAQISAAMEAIEGAVAENVRSHIAHICTFRQLRDEGRSVVPLALLSRVRFDVFDERRERRGSKAILIALALPF